jgi:16S rRNA A1518/A1519 N6-dimethyltransferase RsmA/KsgA/DIM1 with predicted DNA glycosylase/AP lyase activity
MSQKKEVTINNPYTDWQEAFDYIPNKDQMTIIELGCGEGTQYLLDNFKKVISIEYSRYPYDFTVTLPKHIFVKLEASQETIEKDDVLIETMGETRPDFTEEVDMLMGEIKKYKADMIFVDFGFHFRGEVVEALVKWDKIKIIAFHDINEPYYGYPKPILIVPSGLDEQPQLQPIQLGPPGHFPNGQGTVILDLGYACS